MADGGGFKIASAFVDVGAKIDRAQVERTVTGVNRQLADIGKDTGAEASGQSIGQQLGNGIKKGLAFFGGFELGKQLLSASSDLQQSLGKTDTIFANSSKVIHDWSSGAAESMGMSRQAAEEAAGSFGTLFSQVGMTTQAAADMSMQWIQLAADIASFNNVDPALVMEALSAATRGEYDSLQAYVPMINAAAVETKAMALSGKSAATELTALDKIMAVNALTTEQTSLAQGDFARTSESAANTWQTLKAKMVDAAAAMGSGVLPGFTELAGVVGDQILPTVTALTPALANVVAAGLGPLGLGLQVAVPLLQAAAAVLTAIPAPLLTGVAGMSLWAKASKSMAESMGSSTSLFGAAKIGVAQYNAQIGDGASKMGRFRAGAAGVGRQLSSLISPAQLVAGAVVAVGASIFAAAAEGERYVTSLREMGAASVKAGFDLAAVNTALREAKENASGLVPEDLGQGQVLAEAAKGIVNYAKDLELPQKQIDKLVAKQKELVAAIEAGNFEKAKEILADMSDDAKGYADAAGEAADETGDLNEQVGEAAGVFGEAATNAQQYKDALDALNGITRSVAESQIDWEDTLTAGNESMVEGNLTLNDKKQLLIDLAGKSDEWIASMDAAGATDAEMAAQAGLNAAAMEELATSLGITTEELWGLVGGLSGLPASTPIKVDFTNYQDSSGQVSGIEHQLLTLPPNTPVLVTGITADAQAQLEATGAKVIAIPGTKDVIVTAPDNGTLDTIREKINNLPSSHTVTINYRTTGGSLGTGGVFIGGVEVGNAAGGPIDSGDPRYRKRMASGGAVTGPGGPTDDRVPFMGSNGEWMMRAAARKKYGDPFMKAVNDGDYSPTEHAQQVAPAVGSTNYNTFNVSLDVSKVKNVVEFAKMLTQLPETMRAEATL